MTDAPYWLQFVQPFGTVLVGLGAFFIGYRQWKTASLKLRLDLYPRRSEIHRAILKVCTQFHEQEDLSQEMEDTLRFHFPEVQILFSDSYRSILQDLTHEMKVYVLCDDKKEQMVRINKKIVQLDVWFRYSAGLSETP